MLTLQNLYHSNSTDIIVNTTKESKNSTDVTIEGSQVTEVALMALVHNCKDIQRLRVFSPEISDVFVTALTEKHRNLSRLSLESFSTKITDAALRQIATCCQKLKDLELKIYKSHFCGRSIEYLFFSLEGLERVNLSGCVFMTNRSIQTLLSQSPELTHLQVNRGRYISYSSIRSLAKARNLQSLVIKNCFVWQECESLIEELMRKVDSPP